MADYGVDMWCADSLNTTRLCRGITTVAQACYHRLITTRGTLRGGDSEANFGLDLLGKLGQLQSKSDDAMLSSMIRSELIKDERVLDATAAVTSSKASNGAITWQIVITITLDDAVFDLVLAVNNVTASIVGIEAIA